MPILTAVEAKGTKGIIFLTSVTLALLIGSVTMVYPFLLMLSGSVRSEMDAAEMDLVPDYFADPVVLGRKFLETKYNHRVNEMNRHREAQDYSFALARIPEKINERRIEDLRKFVEEQDLPIHWWILGGTEIFQKIASSNQRRFVSRLRKRYDNDLFALSKDLGAPLTKWSYVTLQIPEWTSPRFDYENTPFYEEYFELLHDRPLAERSIISLTGAFLEYIIVPEYGKEPEKTYNPVHANNVDSYEQLSVPQRVPDEDQPQLRKEWLTFVKESLNSSFIRTTVPIERYREFLEKKYGDIATLNKRWFVSYASFGDVHFPGERDWIPSAQRQSYGEFIDTLPAETLYLVGPEFAWREWLKNKYQTVERMNAAYGTHFRTWEEARIPTLQIEQQYVLAHKGALKREYASRNFRTVIDEVLLQGRPFINTIIYVVLSLMFTLTIQPLAAYSLSRFSPPGTWRFILIFMATMSFPPMVGMIPQFLILRNLNLLNTYIALVLPIMVNGYMIFLLKGFFDSLPKHLYDAALIDGASELRIFIEISMALSKPILAVIALRTFHRAWITFIYPLLVCPKEEMHVLAVWLQQFQQQAPTPAIFASILITSIPTLVMFLLTQGIIMRGIAVPAEK